MPDYKLSRIPSLDIIRGYAVLVMLFANTAPYIFDLSEFFYLRFLFSTAAPLFIFISGFTTEMNLQHEVRNERKILKRIFQVLFFGVMIDVFIWRICPFITFDVLYLISFGQLFIFYLSYKKSILLKWISLLIIISAQIIVQNQFNYRFEIPEIEIDSQFKLAEVLANNSPIKRLFFDGWFPILPWAAFAVFGSIVFYYQSYLAKKFYLFLILGLLAFVIPLTMGYHKIFPTRDHYLELWYPPFSLMIFIPIGSVLVVLSLIHKFKNVSQDILLNLLSILGKNSLFIYVYHALIISVINKLIGVNHYSIGFRIVLIFCVVLMMAILGLLMEHVKTKKWWINSPSAIKFILGY